MRERDGLFRLQALPAADLWHAWGTVIEYAVGPRSTVTVNLDAAGLRPGNVAGLALLKKPYAWLGVARDGGGFTLTHFDEQTGRTSRLALRNPRVWLRAECLFDDDRTCFRYSSDGQAYLGIGPACAMASRRMAFKSVRCALFAYSTDGASERGHADFDSFVMTMELPPATAGGTRLPVRSWPRTAAPPRSLPAAAPRSPAC